MALLPSGTWKRSAGLVAAVGKQIKFLNLKPVKRITVTFDPFSENARTIREFLFHLSTPKVLATNPNCILKTDIVCNRAEPTVVFNLTTEVQDKEEIKNITFKACNLSTLELLQLYNKHVTSLAPVEEEAAAVQTKSEKKKTGGKRK